MIRERIFEVIHLKLGKRGALNVLSADSNISLTTWQNVSNKKQRVTEEVIEFVCRKWPEFAFYIATGIDPINQVKQTTPERHNANLAKKNRATLLIKEPIDWTNEERAYMIQQVETLQNYDVIQSSDGYAEMLCLQAFKDKRLLKNLVIEYENLIQLEGLSSVKICGISVSKDDFFEGRKYLEKIGHKFT